MLRAAVSTAVRIAFPIAAALLLLASPLAQAQIIKCVGKDGKTYVGQTLPPQCQGQAVDQMNKQGMVVKRQDAAMTAEQRAAREAEQKAAKEKAALDKEEARKNKALLSTYGSDKDIEVARQRALKDNEVAVQQTQAKIDLIDKRGVTLKKELEFFQGKNKPPAKLMQDIQNNDIDRKAQQDLLSAKKKEVEVINAKYDEDKRRYLELTKGGGSAKK
ncbi:MAG: DUF4124 domain-containing protein [Betaproteobacteria bacterium]|nr:DUF4124 domain-containing protein [Betaproteobacteria bacterium]